MGLRIWLEDLERDLMAPRSAVYVISLGRVAVQDLVLSHLAPLAHLVPA